jgi:hypothetical protein
MSGTIGARFAWHWMAQCLPVSGSFLEKWGYREVRAAVPGSANSSDNRVYRDQR